MRVSIPTYVSYAAAQRFVLQHKDWILQRLSPVRLVSDYQQARLFDDTLITLHHGATRNSTSRQGKGLTLKLTETSEADQLKYVEGCIMKYLKLVCQRRVEPHVDQLSQKHQLYPELLKYKRVRSRWGSCTSTSVISFSIYLAQLPDELIRYVIAHELAHLRHLNHGQAFWQLVSSMDPDFKLHRKRLAAYDMEILLK